MSYQLISSFGLIWKTRENFFCLSLIQSMFLDFLLPLKFLTLNFRFTIYSEACLMLDLKNQFSWSHKLCSYAVFIWGNKLVTYLIYSRHLETICSMNPDFGKVWPMRNLEICLIVIVVNILLYDQIFNYTALIIFWIIP